MSGWSPSVVSPLWLVVACSLVACAEDEPPRQEGGGTGVDSSSSGVATASASWGSGQAVTSLTATGGQGSGAETSGVGGSEEGSDSTSTTDTGGDLCVPGSAICDGHVATTCLPDGSGSTPGGQDCAAAGKRCFEGSCTVGLCAPDSFICVDNHVHRCSESGDRSELYEDCLGAGFCVEGVPSCIAHRCEPGERSCDELGRSGICNEEGSGLATIDMDCPALGMACDHTGACTERLCTPGGFLCVEGNVHTCGGDARSTALHHACRASEFCPDGGQRCLPDFCAPHSPVCKDDTAHHCAWDGSGLGEPAKRCASFNQVCRGDHCVSKTCSPSCASGQSCGYEPNCDESCGSCAEGEVCDHGQCESIAGRFVVDFAVGERNTCAWLDDGAIDCWGTDATGELGDGGPYRGSSHSSPVRVTGLEQAGKLVQLVLGQEHICARNERGQVYCWGDDSFGQVGDRGPILPKRGVTSPVPVAGFGEGIGTAVVDLGAGRQHTCALRVDGQVYCWGSNADHQLGQGEYLGVPHIPYPMRVRGLSEPVVELSVGGNHNCVRLASGALECWGANGSGQLGDGRPAIEGAKSGVPNAVIGLSGQVEELALGGGHSCARLSNGVVSCWGANDDGQLGRGYEGEPEVVPAEVQGLSGPVLALVVRGGVSCVVMQSGPLLCWGYDKDHALGTAGSGRNHLVPEPVAWMREGLIKAAHSGGHGCGLVENKGLFCWGRGSHGQLGGGSKVPEPDRSEAKRVEFYLPQTIRR